MEAWFKDARRIASLEAEIGFVLQEDFYYGPDRHPDVTERKLVDPLPTSQITRHAPSIVTTTEALENLDALSKYYSEILRLARKHSRSFNEISYYFWLRFWLANHAEDVIIGFPWYDTLSEIDSFLRAIAEDREGQLFWDVDEGWELEVHSSNGDFFFRIGCPEDNEQAVFQFPRQALLDQINPLRDRTAAIIKHLSTAIGRDVWTNRVEWPEFAAEAAVSDVGQPWWRRWLAIKNS